jgi:hypothetical protein
VYFGSPAKRIKGRSKRLLELEEDLKNELAQQQTSPKWQ